LLPSGIVRSNDRNFLAAVLAPGMRAVSLTVDVAQAAAGLVEPGDNVDVILAQTLSNATGARASVGSTVLNNVRVVAVDQWFAGKARPEADKNAAASSANGPRTITLEASEQDATRLLVATQLGRVTLALRALDGNYLAKADVAEKPVWAGDVSPAHGGRVATRAGGHAAASGVRILRGSKGATP
jgi:pilus assembly protein CpaB